MGTDNIAAELPRLLTGLPGYDASQLFVLCDEHTAELCLPLLSGAIAVPDGHLITLPPGDDHKNLDSCRQVWQRLSEGGATRHATLLNLGGGMICDLGGFCASTFKRGIGFVNIPTTLLAQVDASLGGKTGVNLGDLKNEIGVFRQADLVLVSTEWLTTLDEANRLSGLAEMLKHGCIASTPHLDALLWTDIAHCAPRQLAPLVADSIAIKERVVLSDPEETGLRKALNFGHTAGHAFETLALRRGQPVLHGWAVAWGMVCELMLSEQLAGLPTPAAFCVAERINALYGKPPFEPDDVPQLLELMHHDKKNSSAEHINFTLLPRLGQVSIDQTVEDNDIVVLINKYLGIRD